MKDSAARIGKVIDHVIDKFVEIILETRKGYNQTVFLFSPSGDNSVPCKDDKAIILVIDGTGNFKGLNILTESQGAKPGEKIFFGRDQEGRITVKMRMLNDGTYILDTDSETTGEATGNYIKKIKGTTDILERKDRTYKNEASVNEEIIQDYNLNVGGNLNIKAGGTVKINGSTIHLN